MAPGPDETRGVMDVIAPVLGAIRGAWAKPFARAPEDQGAIDEEAVRLDARGVYVPPLWAKLIRYAAIIAIGVAGVLTALLNVGFVRLSIDAILRDVMAVDWVQYLEAARRVDGGVLYEVTDVYAYHYSPVLAYAFGPLGLMGAAAWRLLHLVAVVALPTWPMRILALLSWPFWYDVQTGNLMIFVVLAAAWALRGSRLATGAYLALLILIPRPLMLPVAAWLLWQRPGWRGPFVAALALHALVVLASGWGDEWLSAMLAASGDAGIPSNLGPSRFIGTIPWMVVGLPLAAWLTWKGRVGIASLAASPYWLPYYLLMLVVDLRNGWPWRFLRLRPRPVAQPGGAQGAPGDDRATAFSSAGASVPSLESPVKQGGGDPG